MPLRIVTALTVLALLALGCDHPCPSSRTTHHPPPAEPAAPHEKHDGDHHGQHAGPLVHSFDEGGEFWAKRFEGPDRDAYQQPAEVVKAMALSAGMTVADLGTGTGYFLPHLSPAVGPSGRVLAIDIEPKMVRYVQERIARDKLSNVEARLSLPEDPLVAPASVDRFLIVNTWHHIADRDRYAGLLVRALKSGGEVWIVDFTKEAKHGPAKHHRLVPEQVVKELAAGGLSTRLDTKLLAEQYIVIGTKP